MAHARLNNIYKQDGLSLVEVLIAMVIVGVCVVAFLQTEGMKWSVFNQNQQLNRAIKMMENSVESWKITIRSNPNLLPSPGFVDSLTQGDITLYTRFDEAINPHGDTLDLVRKMDMKAIWKRETDGGSLPDSLETSTYIASDF